MQGFSELIAQLSAQLDAESVNLQGASLTMAEYVLDQLACSRVSVWVLADEPEGRVMRRIAGFDGTTRTCITEPAALRGPEMAGYFEALSQKGLYVCPDVRLDPHLAALRQNYLEPNGIRATLDATIGVNGITSGVYCCSQAGEPRDWTPREVRMLKGFADAISVRRARRRRREAEAASLMQRLLDTHGVPADNPER